MAPNDSLNNTRDRLQALNVGIAEIAGAVAVNVDHAGGAAVSVKERDHNLRPRRGAAGYMARKFIYVRNNDHFTRRIRVSAHAFIKIDNGYDAPKRFFCF